MALTAVPFARGGRSCVLELLMCGVAATAALRRTDYAALAVRYREQQPTFIPPMLLTSGALPERRRVDASS